MTAPEKNQKVTWGVVVANVLLLLFYQFQLGYSGWGGIKNGITMGVHILAVILISATLFTLKKDKWALGFIISALFILLVGAGTCTLANML